MRAFSEEDVRRVVEEVLRELGRRGTGTEPPRGVRGKLLVFFTGAPGLLEGAMSSLRRLSSCFELAVGRSRAASSMAEFEGLEGKLGARPLDLEDLYGELSSAEGLVLPTLTQNTAAKVAFGMRDCPGSELAACALLMGKRVVASRESLEAASVGSPYGRLLSEISGRLTELGVLLLPASRLDEPFLGPMGEGLPPSRGEEEVLEGGLLTEEMAKGLVSSGVRRVLLKGRVLVTPLAMDLLREHRVELVGVGGR